MKKILFFDDFFIHRQESIRRVFHTPDWIEDHLYSDPSTAYGVGYSSVVPGPEGGQFLYYITVLDKKSGPQRPSSLRRVESDDGIHWQSGTRQEILGGIPVPAGCCVYFDPHEPDLARRYKMTNSPVRHIEGGIETIPSAVLSSPDGIAWEPAGGAFLPHHSDTLNSLLLNPITGRYQIALRRKWGERRVCLVESSNLESWSDPRVILHPDSLDAPCTHFYGMPQFYLESAEMFVGFLWNHRMPYNDVMGGPVRTEYVYSYDGLLWNRTHQIAMELREPGAFGGGSMHGAALIERDDSILVYAIARLREHSDESSGGLLPGLLRKDGFVSLRSGYGTGEITTECLLLSRPELILNIVAPFGGVRVQLCEPDYRPIPGYTYDDCDEIKGDYISLPLTWRGRGDLTSLVREGRWLRLQIRLREAELFSIDGDFEFNINALAPI